MSGREKRRDRRERRRVGLVQGPDREQLVRLTGSRRRTVSRCLNVVDRVSFYRWDQRGV